MARNTYVRVIKRRHKVLRYNSYFERAREINTGDALTDVEHAVQLYVVRPGHDNRGRHLIVDEQTKHGGRYLQQVYRVPEVVVVAVLGRVPKSDRVRPRTDVDQHVTVD